MMQNKSFAIDTENLLKAGKIPLIASAALGLTWLIKIPLGYFYGPALYFLEAFAGAMYMESILKSDREFHLINAGLNGAILAGVVVLIYRTLSWINTAMVAPDVAFNIVWFILSILEGAFVGFLGALAWYGYKTYNSD